MLRSKGFVLTVIVAVVLVVAYPVALYSSQDTATGTVTSLERVVSSDGDGGVTSKWMILTDTESFTNNDSLLFMKFDSTDVQGQMVVGDTYTFDVAGWRVPFLSMYRNIISAERSDG